MRKVLMVLYFFPPLGGIGVQRGLRFARHLPEFGWQPIVLTQEGGAFHALDPALNEKVPPNLQVVRARCVDPWRPYRWLERIGLLKQRARTLRRHVHFPDEQVAWAADARRRGAEILDREAPDLIFSTSSPLTAHLVAMNLRQRGKIPWLADFRDEWSQNPYTKREGLLLQRHRRAEAAVLRCADRISSVTEDFSRHFRALSGRPADDFATLPNGYEEDAFEGAAGAQPKSDCFTVVYAGSFYSHSQPTHFLEAISRAVEQGEIPQDSLRVVFAGKASEKQIRQSRHPELVTHRGQLPHDEALTLMKRADLLFLLVPTERGRGCIPGKTFEYLAAGRQILALVPPDGAAAELVLRTDSGDVVAPEDVEAIQRAVVRSYLWWKEGRPYHRRNWAEVQKFSGRALTGQLAAIFDDLCAGSRAVPLQELEASTAPRERP